jgi:hypothetical protein
MSFYILISTFVYVIFTLYDVCARICIYVWMHMFVSMYLSKYGYVYIYTFIYINIHVCVCVCMHKYVLTRSSAQKIVEFKLPVVYHYHSFFAVLLTRVYQCRDSLDASWGRFCDPLTTIIVSIVMYSFIHDKDRSLDDHPDYLRAITLSMMTNPSDLRCSMPPSPEAC